ncbi:MAG: hypothetical protein IJF17_08895 [Thermoguttaceae bacterium]|nr:hypothetical protein [Thermoguttaceae bacterium]
MEFLYRGKAAEKTKVRLKNVPLETTAIAGSGAVHEINLVIFKFPD